MTAAEKEKILQHSRSREGAWIEIFKSPPEVLKTLGSLS